MRKVVSSIAVAIVFLATPAAATNGIRMIGFGPVQDSMGGASVAAPLDAAVVLTNPAGVSELKGRIDFGASYFAGIVKYSADAVTVPPNPAPGTPVPPAVNQPGTEFTSDRGPSPIPAFGLVIPIDEKTNFAIGAYGIAGLGTDWSANVLSSTIYSHYSQLRFAPGISYKIGENLAIGATANVMYASLGYSLGAPGFQVPHYDTSAFGVSGTIGVTYSLMKMFTIGAAYETPSAFADFRYNTPPGNGAVLGPTGITVGPVAAGVDKLAFDPPQTATLGASARPIPALLLAFDVQWINWAGVLGDDKPEYTQNDANSIPFDLEWEDQWVYKVGLQLDAGESFKIRAGYNYGKNPINVDKVLQAIAFPAISEHHITAGIGWQVTPKVTLNIGGMYSPTKDITGSQVFATNATPTANPFLVSYSLSMQQYAIDAGISYTF